MLAKCLEVNDIGKKMGRPTDDPKVYRVTARVEEELYKKISKYCEKHQLTIAEGVRQAILLLEAKK